MRLRRAIEEAAYVPQWNGRWTEQGRRSGIHTCVRCYPPRTRRRDQCARVHGYLDESIVVDTAVALISAAFRAAVSALGA